MCIAPLGPDIFDETGDVNSYIGHNIIGVYAGFVWDPYYPAANVTNITGVSAASVISPILADNGGPTPTHAIIPCGPAANGGLSEPNNTDQRGFAMFGGVSDIGAFELQSVGGNCPVVTGISISNVTATTAKYNFAATNCGKVRVHYIKKFAPPSPAWLSKNATTSAQTQVALTNLAPATTYRTRSRTVCSGNQMSTLSVEKLFTTLGAYTATSAENEPEAANFAEQKQQQAIELRLAPNPTQSYCNLQASNLPNENAQIKLLDLSGRTVLSWSAATKNGQLDELFDVSDLPAALYIVRIQTGSETLTKTLVKE